MHGHSTLREKLAPNLQKKLSEWSNDSEIHFIITDKSLSKPTLKVTVELSNNK